MSSAGQEDPLGLIHGALQTSPLAGLKNRTKTALGTGAFGFLLQVCCEFGGIPVSSGATI